MKNLGLKIRTLRTEKGMTIVQMAKSTGIDQATLSRIENGKMTGTLQSHMRIAEALGVRLPVLYAEALESADSPREARARKQVENFSFSTGAVAEILTTGILQKKMMPSVLKLKAKGHTQTEEFKPGTERFVYVLSGDIQITLGSDTRKLSAGESLYFDASVPHHFSSGPKSASQALSVISPVSL